MYRLPIRGTNVYFVRSGSAWVLIDAAWANCGRSIQQTAESLFGANARPAAILLTHGHPDHSGSARELARMWDRPVHSPREELRYVWLYGDAVLRWLSESSIRTRTASHPGIFLNGNLAFTSGNLSRYQSDPWFTCGDDGR